MRVARVGEKGDAVKVASNLGSPGAEEPALVAAAGSDQVDTLSIQSPVLFITAA